MSESAASEPPRPAPFEELAHAITCIDTGLMQPLMTAAYLVGSQGRYAFIETGTTRASERLLAVLDAKGIGREQVDYVIPTHVHLDHAGGAGALVAALPEAQLVIHPRGARHMLDPSRLTAGAAAVYGEAWLEEHYGALVPVPAERVVTPEDGAALTLGERSLRFLHTEGHARHHFVVWDEESRSFFTGDTFGLSLRDHDTAAGPFVYLPSAPVQFDPEAWHASLDRMMEHRPEAMHLTHYGRVESVERMAGTLHGLIDAAVGLARTAVQEPEPGLAIREGLTEQMLSRLEAHGVKADRETVLARLGTDIEINAQGLEVWLEGRGA